MNPAVYPKRNSASDLRTVAQQALAAMEAADVDPHSSDAVYKAMDALRSALAEPERRLTDEIIAELWYKHGTFHHHFARAIERYLKGEQ